MSKTYLTCQSCGFKPKENNMLKLVSKSKNQNAVRIKKDNDYLTIYFSYQIPVACSLQLSAGETSFIYTNKKYSNTISKHINQWKQEQVFQFSIQSQEALDETIHEFLGIEK